MSFSIFSICLQTTERRNLEKKGEKRDDAERQSEEGRAATREPGQEEAPRPAADTSPPSSRPAPSAAGGEHKPGGVCSFGLKFAHFYSLYQQIAH